MEYKLDLEQTVEECQLDRTFIKSYQLKIPSEIGNRNNSNYEHCEYGGHGDESCRVD